MSEDFRKNYCQLWEALIRLDSQKIQQLGETFGVGKYAKYFPVIITGRTINRWNPEALEGALLKCVMVTPEEVIKRCLDPYGAVVRRDGLAKTLYSRLFDWYNSVLWLYLQLAFLNFNYLPPGFVNFMQILNIMANS
ncbi:hypothetical protein ACS0TY_034808 [Phlomoides rotata]